MIKGAFKSICHKHYFEEKGGSTIMKDIFEFEAPFGIFGKLFCFLVLTAYLKTFILKRKNRMLKEAAESDEWKKYSIT